jgi:hypothetical protein
MLNHAVDFGLVEVHSPRLNPIKRVPPLQLRDGVAWSVGAATVMRSLSTWQGSLAENRGHRGHDLDLPVRCPRRRDFP